MKQKSKAGGGPTFILTPRSTLGWPCFYCAKPAKVCRKGPGLCCFRCKGKRSH